MSEHVNEPKGSEPRPVSDSNGCAAFLPGTSIEIVRDPVNRGGYRHILFDFDGTVSLIREGWPDVMIPMMVEVLLETPRHETPAELERLVRKFVMRLNGKQTIYQMIRLAEEVARRGGGALNPLEYKEIYHDRLLKRIGHRRESLRSGEAAPENYLVPGSLETLSALRNRGIPIYLASGTDERFVREEADLLGISPFFGDSIYGAVDDYASYSKQMVIDRILSENRILGYQLLGFGDGYVEIENVKSVGGTAVAVASDEAGRSGRPDAWKRDRLIGVGADIVIPDFRDHRPLLDYLLPQA